MQITQLLQADNSVTTTTITNNPKRAGLPAGPKIFYGSHSRFAVFPMHTRFKSIVWVATDAETPDDFTDVPSIIAMNENRSFVEANAMLAAMSLDEPDCPDCGDTGCDFCGAGAPIF